MILYLRVVNKHTLLLNCNYHEKEEYQTVLKHFWFLFFYLYQAFDSKLTTKV